MNLGDAPQVRQSDILAMMQDRMSHAVRIPGSLDRPYVTLTYAQSVDGCIARVAGEMLQISNASARKLTHQIRALHDAILVGVNTVLSDDPRLTVRLVEGQNPQPVVVDSRLRMPTDKRLFTNHCVPPIILTSQTACEATAQQLADAGARIVRIGTLANGQLDLAEGLRRLRQLGYDSVMIEGGASIITSVLKRRLADQLVLTISPRFVAGLRAVQSSNGSPTPTMPQLKNLQYEWLEENLILRGDFDLTDQQTRSDTATCARVVVPDTTEGEGVNRS